MIPNNALHVAMTARSGIGDVIMTTPALAAHRRIYPETPVVFHVSSDRLAEALYYNPDVAKTVVDGFLMDIPDEWVSLTGNNARENHIRAAFFTLGVGNEVEKDRRLRWYTHPAEKSLAVQLLGEKHDRGYLVGIQVHGQWQTKQWAHTHHLTRLLRNSGARVVWFGTRADLPLLTPGMRETAAMQPDVDWRGRLLPFRVAAAAIGLLDAFVGFDSSLSLIALALGTPLVALTGSHDPRALMGEAHSKNAVFLRPRTPKQCFEETGTSCRHAGNFGNCCPLRSVGQGGANCLDEIQAEDVIRELAPLPTWDNLPLIERF